MVRSRAPNPYAELDDDSQWWVPEQLPIDPAAASVGVAKDGGSLLTQEQVARFHRTGFLVVNGLWPDELVRAAGAEMEQLLLDAIGGLEEGLSESGTRVLHPLLASAPGMASSSPSASTWR